MGPRTAELAGHDFILRELDRFKVKGREAPVAIFEPLAEQSAEEPEVCDRARRYAEALAHYRARRFSEAHAIWQTLAEEEEAVITAEDGARPPCPPFCMAERARPFATHPPEPCGTASGC